MAVAARAGPERVGARKKALLEELGCGMRMAGAHRHERKVGMESAHRHERKTSGMYTGETRVGYGCK